MKPDELKGKVEELHALIVEKLAELEEDPKWGTRRNATNWRKRSMSCSCRRRP